MHISAALHPFEQKRLAIPVGEGLTLLEIAHEAVGAWAAESNEDVASYDWFFEHGTICINGAEYEKAWWPYVKPKPHTSIELAVRVHGGRTGRVMLVLAAVALTVATGFVASGGIASALSLGAGSTFAAGGTGALLAGSAIGMVGSLAISAMTPVPAVAQSDQGSRELSAAGINGNPITPGETLMSVLGRMRVSPQIVIPPYTTLENDRIWVHTMVAVHGRCAIGALLINGVPAEVVPRLQIEAYEGDGTLDSSFLSSAFYKHENTSFMLTDFDLVQSDGLDNRLTDQVTPANSEPRWHRLRKDAAARDLTVRLLFEAGIMSTAGAQYVVPLRVRLRKKGDTAWRNGPLFYIKDTRMAGPFRRELRIKWTDTRPSGRYFARNNSLDMFMVKWRNTTGYAWQWDADAYFQCPASGVVDQLPVMTAPTTSGVTVSASAEFSAGYEAWRAADGSSSSIWISGSMAAPQWWKVDFGAPRTMKSMLMQCDPAASLKFVKDFDIEGSTDNANWVNLASVRGDTNNFTKLVQLTGAVAYRYYRIVGYALIDAANDYWRVSDVMFSEHDSYPHDTLLNFNSGFSFDRYLCRHAHVDYDSATIYLNSASWDAAAEWEVDVQRGWAFHYDSYSTDSAGRSLSDSYNSGGEATYFFTYVNDAGVKRLGHGQRNIASKTTVETVQQKFPFRPITAETERNLARIAIRVPDIQIQSISSLFQSYARIFNGTTWNAIPNGTRNPAAIYRDALLLASKNATPLDQSLLFQNSLEAYYQHCETNGITCDAVIQNRNVHDVCVLLAAVGRASPRQGNLWGVTIDHNRSAETPVGMITPENARDLGTSINFEDIPHGLRCSYFDETDDYTQKNVMVYRAGYNSSNATLIEALPVYDGICTAAAATAQGTYDLRQMLYRRVSYIREVGMEGMTYGRGDLVGLSDDVITKDLFTGLIKDIIISGGNVTGFRLYGTVDFETALSGCGIMVRKRQGGVFIAAVIEPQNSDTVMLITPVADTGQFSTLQLVSIGVLGKETRRVVVNRITPSGSGTYQLQLLPEGNAIFA